MVRNILSAAGVRFAQGRFLRLPAETCAIYFDDIEVETADRVQLPTSAGLPRIYHHSVTVEVYEPAPDDATETAIEAELDARGLPWTKQDRYWLTDSQRYQTVYEFSFTDKFK
jgi:hypothetical protein